MYMYQQSIKKVITVVIAVCSILMDTWEYSVYNSIKYMGYLSAWDPKWHWGIQKVDFQQLRQGASNQIAEQKHVGARFSKGVVYKHYEDKQVVIGLLKTCC